MDENRGRRVREVDIERYPREQGQPVTINEESSKVKSLNRWSWTSSLDFLFSRSSRHAREEMSQRATLVGELSDTDGQSSRVVPMGVAL